MDNKCFQILLVIGMLVTGSINTVSKKMGYNTCGVSILRDKDVTACAAGYCGVGADGRTCTNCREACPGGMHRFDKPWTQTLVMFSGEFMCLLIFFYKRREYLSRQSSETLNDGMQATLLSPGSQMFSPTHSKGKQADANEAYATITWKSSLICVFPAMCDIGGTTLSGIGLLFTTASVFQMLRGSIIIFTAVLSVIFLGRKLWGYHYIGLFLTVIGVTIVGLSSIIGADNGSTKETKAGSLVLIGNIMVILSQLMSATQMVVEEKFLKGRKLPPEFVVGCEGMFGILVMLCVVLPTVGNLTPGLDGGGSHENPIDAVHMLGSNVKLLTFVLMYWISIAFYNFCGLAVAKSLSSVHRCLVDACRTILVWSVDLILFYTTSQYGEKWNEKSSYLQLIGFAIMICGTFIYYKVVKLPFCSYEPEENVADNIKLKDTDELLLDDQRRRRTASQQ
jgi:drug/metabolite transporter (DMT)-like permease